MSDLSRLAIYRSPSAQRKRVQEARELMPLLLRLEQFITIDDVEFGQEPPDFVFRFQRKAIGVELTDLVPKRFEKGGHYQRSAFKGWQTETKESPVPKHTYEWDEFTLRESLAAFENQLDGKIQKARKWKEPFSEKWLLMRVGSGSPFGELVATKRVDTYVQDIEVDDYFAKVTHALFSICQRPHIFDYVILFSEKVLIAFPSDTSNPYMLPTPSTDVLDRGEMASNKFLDWRSKLTTIVEHPLLPWKERCGK